MSTENKAGTVSTHSLSIAPINSVQKPAQNLVKVKIKYPEDWSKKKFFKDGDIKEVSEETAEQFISSGIAAPVVEEVSEETAEGTKKEKAGKAKK